MATETEQQTSATPLDQLGPVDYLVVEFPAGASNFTGEMADELVSLVEQGTIRVIDVLILTKNEDGTVDATELSEIEELGALQAIEAQLAELLAEEDVLQLAAAMEPGSVAGVLIWENLWAAPFASAARRSGGQLIANGRIPIQAIIASLEGFIVFLRDTQPGESFHAERLSRLSVELPSLVRGIPRDLGHAPHRPRSPGPPIVATEALSKRADHHLQVKQLAGWAVRPAT